MEQEQTFEQDPNVIREAVNIAIRKLIEASAMLSNVDISDVAAKIDKIRDDLDSVYFPENQRRTVA
jgi:hypothetical protein